MKLNSVKYMVLQQIWDQAALQDRKQVYIEIQYRVSEISNEVRFEIRRYVWGVYHEIEIA
jgi:hypothetical protein